MFRKIILNFIRFYQKTLSPDKGYLKKYFLAGYCPFTPHCSDYCYQAVEKYGSLKGEETQPKKFEARNSKSETNSNYQNYKL